MSAGEFDSMIEARPRSLSGAALTLRWARWSDRRAVERFLAEDPCANLFVLSWVEKHGVHPAASGSSFRVLIAERDGELLGACLLLARRTAMPVTAWPEAGRLFGQRLAGMGLTLNHIVGPDLATTALWEGYKRDRSARLNREQRTYILWPERFEDPGDVVPTRLARLDDLDVLVKASAAMYREETLADPFGENPDLFRRMHRHRIMQRTCHLWRGDDGGFIFKADLSCVGRSGAQLAGVYTDPDWRGLGIGRRALGHICRTLLTQHPYLTLYVNTCNVPAIRLYERLGFVPHVPYRTIFVT